MTDFSVKSKLIRVPGSARESTLPGLHIGQADWHTEADRQALSRVRRAVFIEEQKVPEALEWDEFDASSVHFLATLTAESDPPLPIGTTRLTTDGQIGRMAVLADWRHHGVASALLGRIVQSARDRGIGPLFLHAQTQAIGFYEAHGFRAQGPEFDDAGIPHRLMVERHTAVIAGQG